MRLLKALLGCLLVVSARAEIEALKAELISEVSAAAPGKTFLVGLHLLHPSGSHTYWKHPGIVGLATRIDWSLPEGVKVGEIQWPAPQKVMMASYETQGYEGETLLMCQVTVPAGFKEKILVLNTKVSWMHCGKTCHPATDLPFSISLAVGAEASKDPRTTPLFERFRQQIPEADEAWKATVSRETNRVILNLTSSKPDLTRAVEDLGPVRFFTADGQIDSNTPQVIEVLPDGGFRLILAVAETSPRQATALPGVLVAGNSWRREGGPKAIAIRPAY